MSARGQERRLIVKLCPKHVSSRLKADVISEGYWLENGKPSLTEEVIMAEVSRIVEKRLKARPLEQREGCRSEAGATMR
jgi:hypothetical protein